jgi:hypothetical protein
MIINSGDAPSGLENILDVFSSNGGTQIASMVEAIKQTDGGEALLKRIGLGSESEVAATTPRVTRPARQKRAATKPTTK